MKESLLLHEKRIRDEKFQVFEALVDVRDNYRSNEHRSRESFLYNSFWNIEGLVK